MATASNSKRNSSRKSLPQTSLPSLRRSLSLKSQSLNLRTPSQRSRNNQSLLKTNQQMNVLLISPHPRFTRSASSSISLSQSRRSKSQKSLNLSRRNPNLSQRNPNPSQRSPNPSRRSRSLKNQSQSQRSPSLRISLSRRSRKINQNPIYHRCPRVKNACHT